mgnify:CR=1 FL=1
MQFYDARFILACVLATVLRVQTGSAQDMDPETLPVIPPTAVIDLNDGVSFEIPPHTGLMGGSGTFGLRLSMNYSAFNLELAGEQVHERISMVKTP